MPPGEKKSWSEGSGWAEMDAVDKRQNRWNFKSRAVSQLLRQGRGRKGWFSLRENHEKAYRQLRNSY